MLDTLTQFAVLALFFVGSYRLTRWLMERKK